MSEPLFLEERRRTILDNLERFGRVSVKALSEQLSVSAVTIRQDLRALEDEGLLERTYGGAVPRILSPNFPLIPELSFDARRKRQEAEKHAIARAAADLVQNGYGIALDASTTAFALTPYLKRFDGLTIVTNSLIIAQQFLDSPRIQVIMPGGRLRRDSIALVGSPETLPALNLTLGFFGARGLSVAAGITDISPDETEMKQALIAHCSAVVVVIDSSKWGQVTPYTYATAETVNRIITTDQAPPDEVAAFRDIGVLVTTASL
ncbi:MAG: DeoR/GlpR transcriptional regulator [Armatimonadetes bacterium]|nr:DeoR/GlpR transcriptional regulator [Anaerolineae bacterium]